MSCGKPKKRNLETWGASRKAQKCINPHSFPTHKPPVRCVPQAMCRTLVHIRTEYGFWTRNACSLEDNTWPNKHLGAIRYVVAWGTTNIHDRQSASSWAERWAKKNENWQKTNAPNPKTSYEQIPFHIWRPHWTTIKTQISLFLFFCIVWRNIDEDISKWPNGCNGCQRTNKGLNSLRQEWIQILFPLRRPVSHLTSRCLVPLRNYAKVPLLFWKSR